MATSLEAFSIFLVRCAQELVVLFIVLIRHPLGDNTYAIIVPQASRRLYIVVTRSVFFLNTSICTLHRGTSLLLVCLDHSPSFALSVWRTAQIIFSIYCTIAYVYVTLLAAFIVSYVAAFCLIIDVVGHVFSYSSFTIFHQGSHAGDAIAIEPSSREDAAIKRPSSAASITPLDHGYSEIPSHDGVSIDHPSSVAALTPLDHGYSAEDGISIEPSSQEDAAITEPSSTANITPLDLGSGDDDGITLETSSQENVAIKETSFAASITPLNLGSSDGEAISIEPPSQEVYTIEQPSSASTITLLDPGYSEISSQEDISVDHPSYAAALTPLDLGYGVQDGITIEPSSQEDIVITKPSSTSNIANLDYGSSAGDGTTIETSSQQDVPIGETSSAASITPLDTGSSEPFSQEDIFIHEIFSLANITPFDLGSCANNGITMEPYSQKDAAITEPSSAASITHLDPISSADDRIIVDPSSREDITITEPSLAEISPLDPCSNSDDGITIEPSSQEEVAIIEPSSTTTTIPLDPTFTADNGITIEPSSQEDVAITNSSSLIGITPLDLGTSADDGITKEPSSQEDVAAPKPSSVASSTVLMSSSTEDRRNYLVLSRVKTSYCLLWFLAFYLMYRWMNRGREVGDNCWSDKMCRPGLICQDCAGVKTCVRATATSTFNIVDNSLPFNKYAFLTTHNAFSTTKNPRYTLHNQEDLVNDQLLNGVRALMLDVYDYQDDIWLCHSFSGMCFEPTAFEPAINTMRVIEAFLVTHPSDIVTLILEDHVKSHHGLSMLFNKTGLKRYWFPVSSMPRNGEDWPRVCDMIKLNHRLLVFTSNRSKESSEEIAYQWNYMVENQYGDAGMDSRWCGNRLESSILSDRSKSLVLVNYFRKYPDKWSACTEHSQGLMDVLHICYAAAGYRWANFLAVDYYKRSDGGGVFQATDMLNGMLVCDRDDIHKCQNRSWKESLLGPVFAAERTLKKLSPLPHDMFFFSEMIVILFYLMYLVDLKAGNEPGYRFRQRHPINILCATILEEARIWGWPWHEFGVM